MRSARPTLPQARRYSAGPWSTAGSALPRWRRVEKSRVATLRGAAETRVARPQLIGSSRKEILSGPPLMLGGSYSGLLAPSRFHCEFCAAIQASTARPERAQARVPGTAAVGDGLCRRRTVARRVQVSPAWPVDVARYRGHLPVLRGLLALARRGRGDALSWSDVGVELQVVWSHAVCWTEHLQHRLDVLLSSSRRAHSAGRRRLNALWRLRHNIGQSSKMISYQPPVGQLLTPMSVWLIESEKGDRMSRGLEFRANAAVAEVSAAAASNFLVRDQFLQVARAWRALATEADSLEAALRPLRPANSN